MNPNDYIRRKDNHKITGVVILHLPDDRMQIAGPFSRMTVQVSDWERVPPVSMLTNIWRFDTRAGCWMLVRDTYPENAPRWIEILQGDEPGTMFKVAKSRPTKAPRVKP